MKLKREISPEDMLGIVQVIGNVTGWLLGLCTLLSLGLVISSAFEINGVIGSVTLVLTLLVFFVADNARRLAIQGKLTTHSGNGDEIPVHPLVPFQIILVLYGFTQTFFWVIDPTNSIHEPRSVFMLAVAGGFAYFRSLDKRTYVANPPESPEE